MVTGDTETMQKTFKPTGYNSLSPYFIVYGAEKFATLLKELLNAEELRRFNMPDGSIMHMEMRIDDSVIMLGEASGQFPPVPMVLHHYVPNVDDVYEKALKLGFTPVQAPKQNEGDSDRRCTLKDFAGNMWSFGTQLEL